MAQEKESVHLVAGAGCLTLTKKLLQGVPPKKCPYYASSCSSLHELQITFPAVNAFPLLPVAVLIRQDSFSSLSNLPYCCAQNSSCSFNADGSCSCLGCIERRSWTKFHHAGWVSPHMSALPSFELKLPGWTSCNMWTRCHMMIHSFPRTLRYVAILDSNCLWRRGATTGPASRTTTALGSVAATPLWLVRVPLSSLHLSMHLRQHDDPGILRVSVGET